MNNDTTVQMLVVPVGKLPKEGLTAQMGLITRLPRLRQKCLALAAPQRA